MRVPYRLTGPIGRRASLGLIALQVDETLEHDFRRLFPDPDAALYVTRIPSGADLTPQTLAAMEADLPRAAGLLPPSLAFGAVGYACTSGAAAIGPERVAALVRGAARTAHVTDPLSAAVAACAALGLRRIGVVSPYVATVSAALTAALAARGVETVALASFEEQVEARVARIDAASVREAARSVGRAPGVEGVLLSCTNLRTLDVIAELEAELGKPVLASNPALAWRMALLAGPAAPPERLAG